MTDKLKKQSGMQTNPAIIEDDQRKNDMVEDFFGNTAKVDRIYIELYKGVSDPTDDAGIQIYQFADPASLEAALFSARKQDNNIILTKDNYLIEEWCDGNSDVCKKIFDGTAKYYQKMGATLWPANKFQQDVDYTTVDTAINESPIDSAVQVAENAANSIGAESKPKKAPSKIKKRK